jgi:hypothetical protein
MHYYFLVVTQILDFSKMEAGMMAIERAPFCVKDLVSTCPESPLYKAAKTTEPVPHTHPTGLKYL